MRRGLLLAALLIPSLVAAQSAREPDLVSGIQQVKDGDLEAAVGTLEAVEKKLARDPLRMAERARSLLYLGVAQVGLGQIDEARGRFRQALEVDPGVRLARTEFSPKVLAVWDAARREAASAKPKAGAPVLPIVAGGAAAVAVGVVVLSGGEAKGGDVLFTEAQFGSPTIVCPNGSFQTPIPLTILVSARNQRAETVHINQVTATLRLVGSQFANEIGLQSREATTWSPKQLDPNSTVTLRVNTTLICHNDPGNAERWNEWKGDVTVVSSAATATLTTVDQLRIENP